MDRQQWDERYRGAELVWSATPNQFVVAESEGLTPGTAVDLACGEHTIKTNFRTFRLIL